MFTSGQGETHTARRAARDWQTYRKQVTAHGNKYIYTNIQTDRQAYKHPNRHLKTGEQNKQALKHANIHTC